MFVCSDVSLLFFFFFFFNDTATTEIYTLSLHDALPISTAPWQPLACSSTARGWLPASFLFRPARYRRSEEHTSELQSQSNLVCRLLLEKKKKEKITLWLIQHRTTAHISKQMPCITTCAI